MLDKGKLRGGVRAYTITPDDDGELVTLGNANDGRVSTYGVEVVPDSAWDGSIAVVARLTGIPAREAGVGFVPIMYKRVNLDGIAADRALVADLISGFALIEVPANALNVAVLVGCKAGSASIFSWPLSGPST